VYRQIRLPIFAVLVYGLSVVDVAIILGPTTPAPLAVRLVRLFNDPDLSLRFVASAGALVQLELGAAAIIFWLGLEWVVCHFGQHWIFSGQRGGADLVPRIAAAAAFISSPVAVSAGLLSMVLWSFAQTWRFPHALPSGFTLANWTRHLGTLEEPLV